MRSSVRFRSRLLHHTVDYLNGVGYAAEFFRALYSDKQSTRRHKRFVKAMEALQDELGLLNDLATGPSVLEEHGLADLPKAEKLILHAASAR